MKEKGKEKQKKKINIKRVIIVFVILFVIPFSIYKIYKTNIKNIFISGNNYLSDQEIIDIAKLENYPNSIKNSSNTIKKRLEKNRYIYSVEVRKENLFKEVYIKIQENYPLFYYQVENKTVLYNGKYDDNISATCTIINKIPDTIYDDFVDKMKNININILNRISQIEYKPNSVDEERFLLFMNDGNYVYLTLKKFDNINKYVDMIKSFDNKKGILHLDSGEYFKQF